MKRKLMALALMLSLVLALVPAQALAAQAQMPEPVLTPMALPQEPALPTADTYKIEMTSTGPGKAELYADKAGARESVYFLADPDPGYKVSFDKCGYHKNQYDLRLLYIGANVYEIVMPDGDVKLDLEFVKIETKSHDVKLTVSTGGMATVDQKTAKKGESLFVEIIPTPGYTLTSVRAKSGGSWLEGYYLGKVNGAELYEVFMPDGDVEILVDFTRNGPYAITPYVDAPGGKLELSHESAYELETVTVTAKPDRGYRVASIGCYHSQMTKVRENVWTFAMPKFKEEVHVRFEAIVYPVSVTVQEPVGGTAFLDTEGATIGQTVTLTCVPNEGYRVAQVTGAKVTDNGDHTYSFVMDNAPVELKVLFLRENNPFLDVNESHFYHDPVLWAVENGITNGIDGSHFGPVGVCNRAQVVTFLWRAAGSPEPVTTAHPFTDVAAGSFYEKAVLWAVEMGITNGLTADTFGPNTVCNRAQVVTFLWRANDSREPGLAENPFTDVAADSFYEKAVLWALEMGITNGLTADTFGPNAVCNRAQVVTFLWRANDSREPGLAENPFTDVAAGSFYEKAVLWALENGVTTGASNTTFNPGGECLRAQVVTFLYRADQIPEPEPEPLPFPDLG